MSKPTTSISKPKFDNAKEFAEKARHTEGEQEKTQRINADIRASLYKKLKYACVDRDTTIKAILEELIEKHL